MGLILDSSLFIADERGTFALSAFLSATRDEDAAISAVTASELLHGSYRGVEGKRKRRRVQYVEAVLARFETIPFDLLEAREHARISSALAQRGNAIGNTTWFDRGHRALPRLCGRHAQSP